MLGLAGCNHVNFDGAEALTGAGALDDTAHADMDFIAAYCADCFEGVERLARWLEAL